jgi:hypothetical protein
VLQRRRLLSHPMMEKYPCLPLPFIAFDILGGPSANQRHD